ncbi:MAG: Plug domain-containing protein [Bacteroidota bacterium]
MKYAYLISILLFSSAYNYQDKIEAYLAENQSEKIYLHLDKKHYGAGDHLWFKAYVVNSLNHLPSELSETVYVELLNDQGTMVDSLMLHAIGGISNGNFKLSRKLQPGPYQIRAYTNWMRNFSEKFFFHRNFNILNPLSEAQTDPGKDTTTYESFSIDFLPEGGDLIDGIGSKVAIKAYDKTGHGKTIEGVIKNSDGKEVTTFNTNSLGMGLTYFVADSKQTYVAVVGNSEYPLPDVKEHGASMRVTHRYDYDLIIVSVLANKVNLKGGHLVAHQMGEFLFATENKKTESFAIKLKKKDLNTGIIHLTYFDSNNVPLTERLIYPNIPTLEANLGINLDADFYEKRSKVSIEIQAPDSAIHSASLVINPTNENHYTQTDPNIVTDLMLTSDMQEIIESPSSYFEGTKEAYEAMDLLMMTQGWIRFNWNDVLEYERTAKKYPVEKGLTVKGQIVDHVTKENPREGIISLTISTNEVETIEGQTAEDGTFEFRNLGFLDSTRLILRATGIVGKKGRETKNVSIRLLPDHKPGFTHTIQEVPIADEFEEKVAKQTQITEAFSFGDDVELLDEIVVSGNRIDERMERVKFYQEPTNRIILDSLGYAPAGTVLDLLRNISGIRVGRAGLNPSVSIRGFASAARGTPIFILDGMEVDIITIDALPLDQVEFVDVLKGPQAKLYSSSANNGAIVVYSKMGRFETRDEEARGLLFYTHPGYHMAKEFYTPQYDIPNEEHVIPDYRSTLYWNPEITFTEGTAKLEFYTSDQTGTFDIRIEGLMKNGDPFVNTSTLFVD